MREILKQLPAENEPANPIELLGPDLIRQSTKCITLGASAALSVHRLQQEGESLVQPTNDQ